MKRSPYFIVLMLLAASNLMAFGIKIGNGKLSSTDRAVKNFSAISSSHAAAVTIKEGQSFSCAVRTDSNLQSDFIAKVENGVLTLGFSPGTSVWRVTRLEVSITMPRIDGLYASGASSFKLEDAFSGKELKIELSGASRLSGKLDYAIVGIEASGASNIDMSGEYGDIAVSLSGASRLKLSGKGMGLSGKLSGASNIEAKGFDLVDADLEASGASNVTVGKVNSAIDVILSGASNMSYAGTPVVKDDLSGSSNLRKR